MSPAGRQTMALLKAFYQSAAERQDDPEKRRELEDLAGATDEMVRLFAEAFPERVGG